MLFSKKRYQAYGIGMGYIPLYMDVKILYKLLYIMVRSYFIYTIVIKLFYSIQKKTYI